MSFSQELVSNNKRNVRLLILLLLISIVFLAGCIQKSTVTTKAGLSLTSFSPVLDKIASKSPVQFSLLVKNTGEARATEVIAALGGLPTDKWGITTTNAKQVIGDLEGVDTTVGFKGGEAETVWRLTAPVQDANQRYDVTVSLFYGYTTSASILIKVVSLDYLLSLAQEKQKEAIKDVISVKSTSGPIAVSLKTDETSALISEGTAGTVPLVMEFTNVGGGRVFSTGDVLDQTTKGNLDKILVDVPSKLKCQSTTKEGSSYVVRLIKDKAKLTCFVAVGGAQAATEEISITAKYRYFVEGKSSIMVMKTLYKPDILDLSVQDSSMKITHMYSPTPWYNVSLDLTLKNVGNEVIPDQSIQVSYSLTEPRTTAKQTKNIPSTSKPFSPFESRTLSVSVDVGGIAPSKGTVIADIETPKLSISKKVADKEVTLSEDNLGNNNYQIRKDLDYDIAVESLRAKVKDASKLSVEITATVKNNAKNVYGVDIPFIIKVDGTTATCDPAISWYISGELAPLASKEVTCIYTNPNKKLELGIEAGVPTSKLETNTQNNVNNKPNGEDRFKILYGLSLSGTTGGVAITDHKEGKFTYQLSTIVNNFRDVVATGSKVKFTDDKNNLLCEPIYNIGGLGPYETKRVACNTGPTNKDKLEAKVVIYGTPDKPESSEEIVASQTFTVTSSTKIAYDFSIVPLSSRGELKLNEIGYGKFNYALSAKVQNTGDTKTGLVFKFIDAAGNTLCTPSEMQSAMKLDPSVMQLDPKKSAPVNCDINDQPFEKFQAYAVVGGHDSFFLFGENEELFTVDSGIKELVFANVKTPAQTVFLYPLAPGAPATASQSFQYHRDFSLTKITVLLEKYGSPPFLPTMKIKSDAGDSITSSNVIEGKLPIGGGVTSVPIYLVNFPGTSLKANTPYWIEISCVACDASNNYGWRWSGNTYTDGRGVKDNAVLKTQDGETDADFGFHLYGVDIRRDVSLDSASYEILFKENKTKLMANVRNSGTLAAEEVKVSFKLGTAELCSISMGSISPGGTIENSCLTDIKKVGTGGTITATATIKDTDADTTNNVQKFDISISPKTTITLNSVGKNPRRSSINGPYETYIPWLGLNLVELDFSTDRNAWCKYSFGDLPYDSMEELEKTQQNSKPEQRSVATCQGGEGYASHICYLGTTPPGTVSIPIPNPEKIDTVRVSVACKDEVENKHTAGDNTDISLTVYPVNKDLLLFKLTDIDVKITDPKEQVFGTKYVAQGFYLYKQTGITNIELYITKTGVPPDDLRVEMQTDDNGKPSGTVVSYASVKDPTGWVNATFPEVKLSPKLLYWIVLRCDSCDEKNHYLWSGKDAAGYYYFIKKDATWSKADGKILTTNAYGKYLEFTTNPWTSDMTEQSGKALKFDAVDDNVRVPSSASLNIGNAFTLMAWIKVDSFTSPTEIIGRNTDIGSYAYGLFLTKGAVSLKLLLDKVGEVTISSVDDEIQTGQWYRLTATYDGTMVRLYRESNEIKSEAVSGAVKTSTKDLLIGNLFNGVIDEVRIYNKALDKVAISWVISGKDVRDGLVAEWKFNEGKGDIAKDTAGNNNGKIYG